MSDKPIILCDMDGVLFDFVSKVFRVYDLRYDPDTYPIGAELHDVLGVKMHHMWSAIDACGSDFWSTLEMYPWSRDLLSELGKLGTVVLSTSPSRAPHSYSGKRLLLQNCGLSRAPCMIGRDKWLMSQSGRVLVDDFCSHRDKWVAGGGGFVLFQQPWNGGNPHNLDIVGDIVDRVKESLRVFEMGGE